MAERKTTEREGKLYEFPVAGSTTIEKGKLVVLNGGNAEEGSEATGLVAAGRAEETVDNSGGSAGDKTVKVRSGVFAWVNSSSDAVVDADVGSTVYIEDDQTISSTDNAGARSAAGKLMRLDSEGAWVGTGIEYPT